jgi:NAD(P)-dependent dehydrogenase (short-subunit alcohol dehydrogenase family)
VSILVNNAGISGDARLGDADSAATWDRLISINLTGVFRRYQRLLAGAEGDAWCIINIVSVVAFTSGFTHGGYTASKGGIRALTQVMCRELAPFGIRVNAVAPGYIDTALGGKGDGVTDDGCGGIAPWHGSANQVRSEGLLHSRRRPRRVSSTG